MTSSMELQQLAPFATLSNIAFLAISSQILFGYIDPRSLSLTEAVKLNLLVASCVVCYLKIWLLDPGRIPKDWSKAANEDEGQGDAVAVNAGEQRRRWCRSCDMPKPPRAHHCKSCKRCIPKMDHHCPWAANCVSHRTLPHFVRFVLFAVSSGAYLQYFLFLRLVALWQKRSLPSYLGPTVPQLATLFVLTIINSITLMGLSLLMLRTIWCITINMTTIESWEKERHETLVQRARRSGGFLEGPGGVQIRITQQEFPYDIGIFSNLAQAMGTYNVLVWPWPFASTQDLDSGLAFEENGIEDAGKTWPPPDPDRLFTFDRRPRQDQTAINSMNMSDSRRRQTADPARQHAGNAVTITKRKPFHVRLEASKTSMYYGEGEGDGQAEDDDLYYGDHREEEEDDDGTRFDANDTDAGEEAWRNSEGERLADFGVEEEVEFYDEDEEVPLAESMRRRGGQGIPSEGK